MEPVPDKDDIRRYRRNKPTAEYTAAMNEKKEQVLEILRELSTIDARYVLNEVIRKMDNDQISVEYFIKE